MTEATAVQKADEKSKLGSVVRTVFIAAMVGMMFLLFIMAAYRKFAG